MNIYFTAKAEVLAKDSRLSADGKTTYHSITILQGSEAGSCNCTADVFNAVSPRTEYVLEFRYNGTYKSLSCTRVLSASHDIPSNNAPTPADTPGDKTSRAVGK